MIKFFRQIRYQLMNKGNTSKYIKYAIGEIVLVVIGILIALSINNWNENRKDQALETKLLREMQTSIERDIGRTIGLLEGRAYTKRDAIDSLLNNILNENVVNKSSRMRNFLVAGWTLSFSYDKGPYESLKSIGLDKITNDSLRGKIVRFYEVSLPLTITFIDINRNGINDRRLQLLEDILEKFYVKNEGKWTIRYKADFDAIKNSKGFIELIDMEQLEANNYVRRLEKVLEEFKEMYNFISKELDLRE